MSQQTPPPLPPVPKKEGGFGRRMFLGLGAILLIVASAFLVKPIKAELRYMMASRSSLQTKAQMMGIRLGFEGYLTEYNRLPSSQSPPPTEDNPIGYDTSTGEGKRIIEILMGIDTQKNPRGINFYEPPTSNKYGGGYSEARGLADVLGTNGYIMILDYNGDGEISDPKHPGKRILDPVLIYSAGPDENLNTWDDNITSWER